MAPPAWLPPLNSHENSIIDVVVCENPTANYFQTLQINGNEIQGNFYIMLHVCVSFYSDIDAEMKMEFPGLSVWIMEPVNVKNLSLLITSLEEIILNEYIIPFQLEVFFYSERRSNSLFCFSNQNQLIKKLSNYVLMVSQKPENAGRKLVGVNVEIKKSVMVPDEEYKSWINWYNEQKRAYPDFEEEYKRAISVPRDPDEVLDEAVSSMARRSARKTIVRELESIVVNGSDDEGGDSSKKSCSICLEEFRGKLRATRLPCHHVFHEDCIVRWLTRNHVCPLCRHRLPVD